MHVSFWVQTSRRELVPTQAFKLLLKSRHVAQLLHVDLDANEIIWINSFHQSFASVAGH